MDLILESVFSPLSFLQLLFSLSRTNTYMCFSYLNFKHLISFVIPGYERWDDSAIWKVQLSNGFWLRFHSISSCPWHIHGTCRNGHHMPSQICLGKTWFSLCLNMACYKDMEWEKISFLLPILSYCPLYSTFKTFANICRSSSSFLFLFFFSI